MVQIQTREAQLISNITYKLHQETDELELRKVFLEMIPFLVKSKKLSFFLSSKNDHRLLDCPIGCGWHEGMLETYIDDLASYDYTNWMIINSKTEVYRETDYFTDEVREQSEYYKNAYIPNGIHFSAQMPLYYSGMFLGVVTLFRGKEEGDFSDKEIFILNLIKDHLSLALYRACSLEDDNLPIVNVEKNMEQYGLTNREVEVFRMILEGKPNEEIAETLFISTFTIRKHVSNIYKKLKVNSKSELLKFK